MVFKLGRHIDAERLRKVFWAFALLTVFINLVDDASIFVRHQISEREDAWVREEFVMRSSFERLVTLFFSDSWTKPEIKAEADLIVSRLKANIGNEPEAQQSFANLITTIQVPPSPEMREELSKYRSGFRRVRSVLDQTFEHQLDRQFQAGIRTQNVILVSNVVDLILILLLLAVYFAERSMKDGIEGALQKSVEDLRGSNLRLEKLTRAHARQLKTAAHDMKSPLAALKGYSELAWDSATKGQPISRLLKRIDELTNASLEMANTLFEDSKTAPPLAKIDLVELLREVGLSSHTMLERKHQTLEISAPEKMPLVPAQRGELISCFHNLIGNAAKYSTLGSKIQIRCESLPQSAKIYIRDQGPGFQGQDYEKMFEPGGVLSARPTGQESSTGYGLYSCKKIVESHGGAISVQNHPEGGAVIEVELPLT